MTDYEKMVADFVNRGGRITRCPTVYLQPITGALPSDADRQAISAHYASMDARKTYPLRQALRDESFPTEKFVEMGRKSQANAREKKVKSVNLTGLGTTVNRIYFAGTGEEITTYRHNNGSQRVIMIDGQGRCFQSDFTPGGRFCGTTWRNKSEFKEEINHG